MDAASANSPSPLEAFMPGDRRRALAGSHVLPPHARGAALFADMSGFTALTEALADEMGSERGAEELTSHLDRVFEALITELDRYGGHVIYFSGDAITCWLDRDDGLRASACALAMQKTIADLAEVVTPAGRRVRLAMKAAVAAGTARRFVVGDPRIQLIDVLAGGLIDALATGERLAAKSEVLLDCSVLEALGDRVHVVETRLDGERGRSFAVVDEVTAPVVLQEPSALSERLPVDVVRPWILPSVYERVAAGRDDFLAELRPAFPLFVRFGGVDFDSDESAVAKLDDFIRRAQHVLADHGGNLLHLTIGDKGAYLSAVFGAPTAHEDDAARACSAALELRALEAATAVRGIAIGLAYGRARSGTVGHPHRKAFTCLGDAVNLAARLMTSAPVGGIYVSDTVRAATDAFAWKSLAPLSVKGKARPIAVSALLATAAARARPVRRAGPAMVGRKAELASMLAKLDEALAQRGQIVSVCAEAGMGKSRLLAEFARQARRRDVAVAIGECQAYGVNASYFVWRSVWSTLFGIDARAAADDRVRALEAGLRGIDASLLARAPLLSAVLAVTIADNDLTSAFDAKLRKLSLEGLLVECLRAIAARGPLVVVLEDCHWIDPLSRDLLAVLGRSIADLDVMFMLAHRPAASADDALGVENLPYCTQIRLRELPGADTAELIRASLARHGVREVPEASPLVDLVTRRAQGNPFYVEELVHYICSKRLALHDASALRRLELPDSLQSLVLGRIDQLPEEPKRTLKVASVLGRSFRAPMLVAVYPSLGEPDAVRSQLATLMASDLVLPEAEAEARYAFKHVVTQQAAYDSMPFALRSTLHERAAEYIERVEADAIDRNLDLLAYHYWHSANADKKREYLQRAGEAAQASYANDAAIDYFERLQALVEPRVRIDVLLKLVKVLEVAGRWRHAETAANQALALAEQLADVQSRAASETALAEVARKQGRYDEAFQRLDRAERHFRSLGDEAGVGQVMHLHGTIAAQRGDYEQAIAKYEFSLAIRERIGDKLSMAGLLSNLGVIAEYRGDYERSRDFHERALAVRTEIGDRRGLGVSTNCLGMVALLQSRFAEARDWFQRSIDLNRQIGDGWMVAICNNNLGNANRGLADFASARQHYAESLRAYGDFDDRWALAFLLEDIGILAALDGDARSALSLLGAADTFRTAIGAPRAPSRELEIDALVTPAIAPLTDIERAACRARGRELDLAAATALANGVLSRGSPDVGRHAKRAKR
jgi:class 3 adenylate cyclase/tetratricopeptide (TPR) repeat protein